MNRQAVFGAVAGVGLIIQIVIGFALAGSGAPTQSVLIVPHMVVGITGVAVVAYLAARMMYSASMPVRFLSLVAFLLVLAQAALGFRILTSPDPMLVMAHQGDAIAILVLIALTEMLAARLRRGSASKAAPLGGT